MSYTLSIKNKKNPNFPHLPTAFNLNGFTVLSRASEIYVFFVAQCKDIYVLYSSGKVSVCSWTFSSALVEVNELSQQFVFQSRLKVEPGYSFPNTLTA